MNSADEIARSFAFLEGDLGYRRTRSEYSPAHFGNAIVEYQSPRLRIRVTKDRSQYLCDFAAAGEPVEWFDQEVVFRDLGEDEAVDALIAQRWSSLEAVASSVERTLKRVCERFRDETYVELRARLEEGRRRRMRNLFGNEFAKRLIVRTPKA